MKRVEIIFDEANENEIMMILRQAQVADYSRYGSVTGHGSSGSKLNNAIGPGINNVLVVYVEDEKVEKITASIRRFKEVSRSGGGHAGTRCIVSSIEEFI
jgi:nitrogen regulatory protein PII